jgi:carbonic anhydrase
MMVWNEKLKAFSITIKEADRKLYQTEFYPIDAKTNVVDSKKKKVYVLHKVIFRISSEHKIIGKESPMEIEFYHHMEKPDPKYNYNRLAFSVLVEPTQNEPDQLLANVLPDSEFEMVGFVTAFQKVQYFHYQGSLSFPPCTQDVNWFVMNKKFKISEGIYTAMKDMIKKKIGKEVNNRPTQEIRMRKVYKFGEDPSAVPAPIVSGAAPPSGTTPPATTIPTAQATATTPTTNTATATPATTTIATPVPAVPATPAPKFK